MNLTDITAQLERLEQRYQEWIKPINRMMHEKSYLVNRGGYSADDYTRDVNQIREQQRAKYDPYQEIYHFLDELCPAYLAATSQERQAIRLAVADKGGVLSALLGYAYRSAEKVRALSDVAWLRRGLAAVSIENCSKDYRDVLLALAELYVSAEEVGLKPRSEFTAIAALSSDKPPKGGDTPMNRMLADFTRYGVLRERRRKSEKK